MSLDGIKKTRSTKGFGGSTSKVSKEFKAYRKKGATRNTFGGSTSKSSSRNPYMQFFFTKFGVTIFVILLILFSYFLISVRGATTIGVTLTTNPGLERGLIGHWTFDGRDVDLATTTTANILDRSGQGINGNMINF